MSAGEQQTFGIQVEHCGAGEHHSGQLQDCQPAIDLGQAL
jgi:hypothetical protein